MNLPNKLTMFRIILIPVFVVLYIIRDYIGNSVFYLLGVVFVIASLTDYFDGKIARSRGLVTTFGKFIDPLADKLLVMAALLVLSDFFTFGSGYWMPFWVPLVILSRELIVTSIRLVAVGEGKIIAASKMGKYKTAVTMLTITYYLFLTGFAGTAVFDIIAIILTSASIILTIVSGVDYFNKNKKIILESI
ncbi:MAG: CDP-diacylglycerol--glycerol-3-phosphate 3-phosphatidyltransferase [Candidatus Izemoplasmatales bacterium]